MNKTSITKYLMVGAVGLLVGCSPSVAQDDTAPLYGDSFKRLLIDKVTGCHYYTDTTKTIALTPRYTINKQGNLTIYGCKQLDN